MTFHSQVQSGNISKIGIAAFCVYAMTLPREDTGGDGFVCDEKKKSDTRYTRGDATR